jgi:outer membrane cobalamin receptor
MATNGGTVAGWAAAIGMAGMAMAGEGDPIVPLADMVVTATRTELGIWDVPASVEVIDFDEVNAATAIQVDELFKTVNGVDLQGSGLPGSQIKLNLRGLTPGYQSKRVLVLIDGRRVNDAFQGNAEFALIPTDAIERIEVLRGPASALYGSNAMGGVINIVTRRGGAVPTREVRVAGGDHGTWQARVNNGGQAGPTDWFVALSSVDTDGYTHNTDGTDRDWAARNLAGNVGCSLTPDSELRGFAGVTKAEGREENSDRDTDKDYEQLRYTAALDEAHDAILTAQVYRNAQRDEYDWTYPGVGIYRMQTLGSDVQQTVKLGESQRVTAGMEARRDSADVDDVMSAIDEHSSVFGLFGQDEATLTDWLTLTLGLRNDHNSDYGDEWSPRAGLAAALDKQTEVFGSVNRAHRAPALSDRFVRTEYNGYLFEGNPDLQPETLTSYELGVRRRLGADVETELVGFYTDMRDSFDFILEPEGVFLVQNVTQSRLQGAEATVRWAMTPWLRSYARYALTDGEYEEFAGDPTVNGNELAYLAADKVGVGVEATLSKRGTHGLHGRYVGDRYGDAQNTDLNELDEYVTLDWRSRVPVGKQVTLTLNVDNILDESYEDFPGVEQPGRFVMAGMELAL